MSAVENARAALAKVNERLTRIRLGRSLTREMDYDIIALRDAEVALRALIEPPADDEREALALVIEEGWGNPTWDGKTLRPIDRSIADAVLAAGYRRTGPITDAQVDAAWRAYATAPVLAEGLTAEDAMRAALEAARTTDTENRSI